ncbi:MAG: NADH-quinone oxidoreductase subunit NuoN [Alphaproteobacteria bacterium]|jgi:NADH-quinone oxidoreductase subunit N|nr:NADH-quinone oxidoreductase subunit NuoN [Alphaproteobacteria bacterium]
MIPFIAPDLMPAFPEISLAILALMLLMFGVSRKEEPFQAVSNLSIFALLAVGAMICRYCGETVTTFNGMFISDSFGGFMKMLVIAGSAVSILMAAKYAERQRIMRFEYPILILFATLGMLLMISANDLISLYMGLEMQSLPLYVLAAIQRDSIKSTEGGLKYFVLGALSSGMLLYGASLLYGYTGVTNFDKMATILAASAPLSLGVIVGMVMLISGLAFKISAVPFHMWTPDVYEGAPTSVTAFFAIAPKIAALALLTRVFMGPFGSMVAEWQQIVVVLAIASMVLGSVAAIGQTNIKRLLAYSSIGNMGYALVGLASASAEGVKAVMIFSAIYMVMTIGTFAIVLMMKQRERMLEEIADLSGLGVRQPMLALAMTVMMFSMAGIPPLAGFFGKLFVFQAAVAQGLYWLAVIGVITSVIAAYYYLRIIKVMYFEEAGDESLDPATDVRLNVLAGVSTVAMLLFIALPGPLLASADAAAKSIAIFKPK